MTTTKHFKRTILVLAIVGALSFIIFYLYQNMNTLACFQPSTSEPVSGQSIQDAAAEDADMPDTSRQYSIENLFLESRYGKGGACQQGNSYLAIPVLKIRILLPDRVI